MSESEHRIGACGSHDSHALRKAFPALDAATEEALRASIERFGVIVPVVRDQHGRTLDGHVDAYAKAQAAAMHALTVAQANLARIEEERWQ